MATEWAVEQTGLNGRARGQTTLDGGIQRDHDDEDDNGGDES